MNEYIERVENDLSDFVEKYGAGITQKELSELLGYSRQRIAYMLKRKKIKFTSYYEYKGDICSALLKYLNKNPEINADRIKAINEILENEIKIYHIEANDVIESSDSQQVYTRKFWLKKELERVINENRWLFKTPCVDCSKLAIRLVTKKHEDLCSGCEHFSNVAKTKANGEDNND